jgi:hypothetical protein
MRPSAIHDAEVVRAGFGQFGDVIGHGAIPAAGQTPMQVLQQGLDGAGLGGGGHDGS